MRYDYDMLGNRIHQASMDAGERWMLNESTGKPLHTWDSRGHPSAPPTTHCGGHWAPFWCKAWRGTAGRAQRLWRNPRSPEATTCAARSFTSSIRLES